MVLNREIISAFLFIALFHRSEGQWIKTIAISYTNDEGGRDPSCLSEDINKGFKGTYTWICPVYTINRDEAATSFILLIQKDQLSYPDLAKGTGGDYRYIFPVYNPKIKNKITRIMLSEYIAGDGSTGDINKGRGGRFLYLNWEVDAGS